MSILNISGRTDVVAFYSKWLINRLEEGFFDVRNPFYPKLVNRIYMKNVDLVVFCTKNPLPIIDYIPKINKPILFNVTLTSYKKDIEPNVIDKKLIIEGIKKISKIVGKNNIIVRYDPILINDNYTIDYHIKAFEKLTNELDGYINQIIVSFIDDYKNVRKNIDTLKYKKVLDEEDYKKIGISFSQIAASHNMTVRTCCEERNLWEYGFIVDDCLSKAKAYQLTGKKYPLWNERNSLYCKCAKMVDIGAYNSCLHLCKYCYANFNEDEILDNYNNHFDDSTMLVGRLKDDDEIKEMGVK